MTCTNPSASEAHRGLGLSLALGAVLALASCGAGGATARGRRRVAKASWRAQRVQGGDVTTFSGARSHYYDFHCVFISFLQQGGHKAGGGLAQRFALIFIGFY